MSQIEENENKIQNASEVKEVSTKLLDKTKPSDLKEKSYLTRQVESSIILLNTSETEIVLEALLFLSKYADLQKSNLTSLIKCGTIDHLLNNYKKNICILRLSLRLLSNLLDTEDGVYEMDQDKYDDKILEISSMYMEHKDAHVKEFCVEILAKIASSCRITTMIFQVDLLSPIFDYIKTTKNLNILYYTMQLLYKLLEAPAAVTSLSDCPKYELTHIVAQINHKEAKISNLALEIIEKLTIYGLDFIQEGLRHLKIIEKMFKIIMDESKIQQHNVCIQILQNCLNSEVTSTYYVESIEFLEICQWLKTCLPKYLLTMIEMFCTLTSIPELKQMLFDLSVEETILYFFRLKDKVLMNKTCQAISNMTSHKYCCEAMLTSVIAETLVEIMQRVNDIEDPFNEVALKTVFLFIRRYVQALDVLMERQMKPVIFDYFYSKSSQVSKDSFMMVLEIVYKCILHSKYQIDFLNENVYNEILQIFEKKSEDFGTICCEIMTNLITVEQFRRFFLKNKGPENILQILKQTNDMNFMVHIFYLIFSSLIYEDIAMEFLHSGLLILLKSFNRHVQENIPICTRVRDMALNYYLPLKFYETGKIDITDKLPNKFYVINGHWIGPFPFLEILEAMFVCPYPTIYVIDYSYEVVKNNQSNTNLSRHSRASSLSLFRDVSIPEVPSVFDINYGQITKDVFLPRYIYHLQNYEKYCEGEIEDRIHILAEYVDTLLCGVKEDLSMPQKIHEYQLHIECLKQKLGNNIIPVGYLRLGFHCERALLFKALADKICIPCSLVRGSLKVYWNEVALFDRTLQDQERIRFYIVDLMNDVGRLMLVGSKEANKYCGLN